MKDAVILKSNRYGIHLKLNPEIPFEELTDRIVSKFNESAKFFKGARFAISFEGRELSSDEEFRIVEEINEKTDCRILCIVDEDEIREEVLLEKTKEASIPEPPDPDAAEFYRGTVRSGQVVESEKSIIVLGDVNAGGKVISHGNIIVLGSLTGKAHAGCEGKNDAFICALDMNPAQLKINLLTLRDPDKSPLESLLKRRKGLEPKIAYVDQSMIVIDSISKGLLNLI